MKIFPRLLELSPGEDTCHFRIKNAANDDRVLLFKIRRLIYYYSSSLLISLSPYSSRSEPKLLDFSPKKGIVEPGAVQLVELKLVNEHVTHARVLVKLVAVKRNRLTTNFDESWAQGAAKGVVKKVVDVRNNAYDLDVDGDGSVLSDGGSEDLNDMAVSSKSIENYNFKQSNSQNAKSSTKNSKKSSNYTNVNTSSQSSQQQNPRPHFNKTDIILSMESEKAASKLFESIVQDFQPGLDDPRILLGLGLGLGVALKNNNGNNTNNTNASFNDDTNLDSTIGLDPQLATLVQESQSILAGLSNPQTETNLAMSCSKIRPLSNSATTASPSVVIEIDGQLATDDVVYDAIETRVSEVIDKKKRVVGVEIYDAPVRSLDQTIGGVFSGKGHTSKKRIQNFDIDDDSNTLTDFDDTKRKLEKVQSLMLEDSLKHITIRNTALLSVDTSILRYSGLVTLDLSSNHIQTIEGLLNLPNLVTLILSNNRLRSLDYLQSLTSLKNLAADNNCLSSLQSSINMLIPLKDNMQSLNLANNPVSSQPSYADTVISLFKSLKVFDSVELAKVKQKYTKGNGANSTTGTSPRTEEASKSTPAKKEFEFRVQRALKSRDRHSPSKPSVTSTPRKDDDNENQDSPLAISEHGESYDNNDSKLNTTTVDKSSSNSNHSATTTNKTPFTTSSTSSFKPKLTVTTSHEPKVHISTTSHDTSGLKFSHQTKASRGRRQSTKMDTSLVDHWASHKPTEVPRKEKSPETKRKIDPNNYVPSPTLIRLTKKDKLRRKSFGIVGDVDLSVNDEKRGTPKAAAPVDTEKEEATYFSDSEFNRLKSNLSHLRRYSTTERTAMKEAFTLSLTHDVKETQEDERYSIWHPRYRVPKQHFGFSKPFYKRINPSDRPAPKPPSFDKFVKRIRDGWEKIPTRGTFTRASKGLLPEWYPMDFDEVEAIRRQGYFHEVIGDIQKYSYRDIKNNSQNNTAIMAVDPRGSVTLSPHRRGTRSIIGSHVSRQYKLVDDDHRGSSSRSFYYLSEDGSYTDFNSSADNSKQYNNNSNQYYDYNNQPDAAIIANSSSNIGKLFERTVDNEDIHNNVTSYDDMRQSKVSHQSDEESQLSAYLQWLEAQHVKDDVEDDSHQLQQQYRSYDDMDVPRHPRDLAMKGER